MAMLVEEAVITFNDNKVRRVAHDSGSMKFDRQNKQVSFKLAGQEDTFDLKKIKKIELQDGTIYQLQNL